LAVHGEESRGEQEQQKHRPSVPRATGHLRIKEKRMKEIEIGGRRAPINLADARQSMRHVLMRPCARCILEMLRNACDEEFDDASVRARARMLFSTVFLERVSNKILKET